MFYVLLKGEGHGCDYTIACNVDWKKLKATTLEEAKGEVEEICSGHSEPGIDKAIIIEARQVVEFDVAGFHRERHLKRLELEAAKALAREKLQYEELKKKFG